MALPKSPKVAPRTEPLSMKVSKVAMANLAALKKHSGLSNPDIIEILLDQEVTSLLREKNEKPEGKR